MKNGRPEQFGTRITLIPSGDADLSGFFLCVFGVEKDRRQKNIGTRIPESFLSGHGSLIPFGKHGFKRIFLSAFVVKYLCKIDDDKCKM